jgi:hypothetical protein
MKYHKKQSNKSITIQHTIMQFTKAIKNGNQMEISHISKKKKEKKKEKEKEKG